MTRGASNQSDRKSSRVPGHTPIPRYRSIAGPAMLTQGFRPFFLLAGILAPLALGLSWAMIEGWIALPTAFGPIAWHYHELLFGYVAAVVAGFLLTAIPNWTGRLPLQGAPLLFLVALWLAGRVAVALSALIGAWPAALIDLAFLASFAAVILREILAGRNWRNLPIVSAVLLLLACNALSHAALLGFVDDGIARRSAIAVIIALISLIGGRIIPSFTRNWLAKRKAEALPRSFGPFDQVTLGATVIALAWWAAAPFAASTGVLAGLAALLNVLRLARWGGLATRAEPLVWVLHLGFLWVPTGLGLLAASVFVDAVPQSGAIHALSAGAIGTMTLAVMSRATLGHSGRALHAGRGLTAAYILVTIAALARVIASALPDFYTPLLLTAATAWIAAFLFFLGVCGPMLLSPRPNRLAG